MKRREFLAASCAAGLAPLSQLAQAAPADAPSDKQILELRVYRLTSEDQRKRLDEFLGKVEIPALNRFGITPVGVFTAQDGKSQDLYVLVAHKTAESVVSLPARLTADEKYNKDGQAFLDLPKTDPPFDRIESSLLLAFDGCPKVEVPEKKDTRIYQLRIYESFSARKALKKIEMFNTGGEMALFRKLGMAPVFFGQAIVSNRLPHLSYMVTFPDAATQKACWDKFMAAPEWDKLKNDAAYADTVIGPKITNLVLVATPSSQV
jgi:hypothetical protein